MERALQAFLDLMSDEALQATYEALLRDDPALIQGATTIPPPLMSVQDWPVEGACLVSYGGWKGDGLETVGETEEYFARMCFEVDQKTGEPGACRYVLNPYDETPRKEMRDVFLPHFARELNKRGLLTCS